MTVFAAPAATPGLPPGVRGVRADGGDQVDEALRHARAMRSVRLRELADWLAIPSVSGEPGHAADRARAAHFLAAALRRAGARVRLMETAGAPPVVVGHASGPPRSPVVLVYGHYDVQPAGAGWTTQAYHPVVRGGMLVARGANDDKGQLYACLAALRAWHDAGRLPITVVMVAEGEEEVGSPHLAASLASLARRMRADVIVVCDTERAPDGVPAITVSQRGHAVLEVVVDVGGPPVHAGRLGGAVVDPSMVLARVLLDFRRELPRLAGSGVSTAVPPDESERMPLEFDDGTIARAAGGRAMLGAGLDRRITRCPALTVLELQAGPMPGAVPTRAAVRLDLRVPPGVAVDATLRTLRRTARSAAPPGVRLDVGASAVNPGFADVPSPLVLAALDRASLAVFRRPVGFTRSGGSLPAVGMLARAFGVTPVLLGLGTPFGGAHGPDEHLDIEGWTRATQLLVRLLAALARGRLGHDERATSRQSRTRLVLSRPVLADNYE